MIVATPRDIGEPIIYERRHDVNILLEHCRGVDLENCLGVQARQVFNGVEIKRFHNLLILLQNYGLLYDSEKTRIFCNFAVMKTSIILKKITNGSLHFRGDREIDYTILEEEYYAYEILYKERNFDRFFVKIQCTEYDRLYIAGGSVYNLLKIIETQYTDLLESEHIDFEIGLIYRSELQIISEFDGYTGRYTPNQRKTIKQELQKFCSNKIYIDIAHNIALNIIHH